MGEAVIVAGIGCRQGVSAEDVVAAVERAFAGRLARRPELRALATAERKAGEPALRSAAERLAVPLLLLAQADLAAADARGFTRSARSLAVAALGSLSEAAALAGAGPRARLIGPRIALGPVTCALAEGDGP